MDRNSECNDQILKLINDLKSKGSFDQFRRECLGDIDTKVKRTNF